MTSHEDDMESLRHRILEQKKAQEKKEEIQKQDRVDFVRKILETDLPLWKREIELAIEANNNRVSVSLEHYARGRVSGSGNSIFVLFDIGTRYIPGIRYKRLYHSQSGIELVDEYIQELGRLLGKPFRVEHEYSGGGGQVTGYTEDQGGNRTYSHAPDTGPDFEDIVISWPWHGSS